MRRLRCNLCNYEIDATEAKRGDPCPSCGHGVLRFPTELDLLDSRDELEDDD